MFLLSLLVVVAVDCISAKSLRSKLTALQKSRQKVADGFDLGTLLHIRGNISTYSGQREIKAFYCGVCKDFMVDIFYNNITLYMNVVFNNNSNNNNSGSGSDSNSGLYGTGVGQSA